MTLAERHLKQENMKPRRERRAQLVPIGETGLMVVCRYQCAHSAHILRSGLVTAFLLLLLCSTQLQAATVSLAWDRNPEPDIASYIVSYGTSSGNYTTSVNVGNVITWSSSFTAGSRYYFVLQAVNTAGLKSPNSTEVWTNVPLSGAPTILGLSPVSGNIGTSVTITGSNFGSSRGTSTLRFNGTDAAPTTWNAGSIVAPVPAGATTGPVIVTVNGVASNSVTFSVKSTLPASWLSQDIGSPAVAGQVAFSSGTFTVWGAGGDIWGASDQFRFVYQPIDGDGQVVARVSSIQNQDPWSKAAVMIRQDLTGGSPHAMAAVTPSNGTVFQSRATRGGSSTSTTGTATGAPQWIRIVRSGNSLTAYYSSNGTTWTRMGTRTVTMPTRVYVGLAVTSHKTSGAARGVFTNVAVTGTTTTSQVLTSLSTAASEPAVTAASISSQGTDAAAPSTKTTMGDYDGDGKTDLATYRATTGRWQVLNSSTSKAATLVVHAGANTDIPVPGDYDGDRKADVAFYQPSTHAWSIVKSSDASQVDVFTGEDNAVPVPADYDGDGKSDVAVYAPLTGRWQILKSSADFLAETAVMWGAESGVPVPGDYDGDGKADPAVYQPATGQWRILFSSTDFATSTTLVLGSAADIPVPADYDGDGITDPAVYQPSSGRWLARLSSLSSTLVTLATLGSGSDIPVPGDYDGDGQADVAVFQSGAWHILYSRTKYSDGVSISWGQRADEPLTSSGR
jgi:regulation of enolase protein 1 (concanavalin A-like superfamily)